MEVMRPRTVLAGEPLVVHASYISGYRIIFFINFYSHKPSDPTPASATRSAGPSARLRFQVRRQRLRQFGAMVTDVVDLEEVDSATPPAARHFARQYRVQPRPPLVE